MERRPGRYFRAVANQYLGGHKTRYAADWHAFFQIELVRGESPSCRRLKDRTVYSQAQPTAVLLCVFRPRSCCQPEYIFCPNIMGDSLLSGDMSSKLGILDLLCSTLKAAHCVPESGREINPSSASQVVTSIQTSSFEWLSLSRRQDIMIKILKKGHHTRMAVSLLQARSFCGLP